MCNSVAKFFKALGAASPVKSSKLAEPERLNGVEMNLAYFLNINKAANTMNEKPTRACQEITCLFGEIDLEQI